MPSLDCCGSHGYRAVCPVVPRSVLLTAAICHQWPPPPPNTLVVSVTLLLPGFTSCSASAIALQVIVVL